MCCALPFHALVKRKIMQNCLVSVVQSADFLTQVFKHWEVFFELTEYVGEKDWLVKKVLGKGTRGDLLKLNVPSDFVHTSQVSVVGHCNHRLVTQHVHLWSQLG